MSSKNTEIELSLHVPFESMDGIVLCDGEARLLTGHMFRQDKVRAFLSEHYPLVEKIVLNFRLGCSAGHTMMTRDVNRCLDIVMSMVSTCNLVLKVELACGDSVSPFSSLEDRLFDLDSEILQSFQDKAKAKLVSLVW